MYLYRNVAPNHLLIAIASHFRLSLPSRVVLEE